MHKVDRADDVGVDNALGLVKILVEKGMAEATSSVCDQDFDRTPKLARGIVELVDTLGGSEISLNGSNLDALGLERPGGLVDFRLVGRDDQIISLVYGEFRQFEANAARGTRDDCKGA